MKNVKTAITINLFYFDKAGQKERQFKTATSTTPVVRNISISNVVVTDAKTAGEIIGLPEMPLTNVRLDNVSIKATSGMTIQDGQDLELRDVQIVAQKGEALMVTNARVRTIKTAAREKRQP